MQSKCIVPRGVPLHMATSFMDPSPRENILALLSLLPLIHDSHEANKHPFAPNKNNPYALHVNLYIFPHLEAISK